MSRQEMALNDKWGLQDAWQMYLPPGRPSREHLSVFAAGLVDYDVDVCVLGSTPELCDLFVELGCRLTYIDKSAAFSTRMQSLRAYPGVGERIIGDWRTVLGRPDYIGRFDLICGDLILGNIPYSDRYGFFSSVRSALRPGLGKFVEKVLTMEGGSRTLDSLVTKYESMPLNLATVNDFANEAFFLSSESANCDGEIDVDRLFTVFRQEWSTRPRMLWLLSVCRSLFSPGSRWYYGVPWSRVVQDYVGVFNKISTWRESDSLSPFYGSLQIICWQGKV